MSMPPLIADYRYCRMRLALLVLMCLSTLTGCSHFGNDMLQITPAAFSDCQGANIVVHVKWDATSVVKSGGVRLFVYKPGRQPALWVQASASGEADTGLWASDGWTVTLVDDHGKLLATRTLQSTACPVAGG